MSEIFNQANFIHSVPVGCQPISRGVINLIEEPISNRFNGDAPPAHRQFMQCADASTVNHFHIVTVVVCFESHT
jgi:hypothetical protein